MVESKIDKFPVFFYFLYNFIFFDIRNYKDKAINKINEVLKFSFQKEMITL